MNWEERKNKKEVREFLLSQLDFKRSISYVGLPAGEAIFEKELISRFEVNSMDLYERDPKIFQQLASAVKELDGNVRIHNADIDQEKLISADFLWLDYCGPITIERLLNLKSLLGALPDDGVLAVTYMVGREKAAANGLLALLGDEPSFNGESPPSIYLKRISVVANSLFYSPNPLGKLRVRILPYADVVPMLLFVFKKSEMREGVLTKIRRTTIDILPLLR